MVARFEPTRGVVAPKSDVRVKIQFTVLYGGLVDELLVCNIEDLEVPLGLVIKAESFGLNVAYETSEL